MQRMPKKGNALAIAMWDFSWLERRYPGGGFEDWEKAVAGLAERGYDVVRIDPYPHLIDLDPDGEFELTPVWEEAAWGAVTPTTVKQVWPNLCEFLKVCQRHHVMVALSGWFRGKNGEPYTGHIRTPEQLAGIWIRLLDRIRESGLYDSIFYVDFINEFPHWGRLSPMDEHGAMLPRDAEETTAWAGRCIDAFKKAYPEMPVTFSFSSEFHRLEREDYSKWDFLEPHIWATDADSDGRFDYILHRENRVREGGSVLDGMRAARELYRTNPRYWQRVLKEQIAHLADISREWHRPLITTECWANVFYVESEISWDWIKELGEVGVAEAARAGCWRAIGTSNFCAPQFPGMWEDTAWHKRMTDIIHESRYNVE